MSIAHKKALAHLNEVAKGRVLAIPEKGAKGMDVDLLVTKEGDNDDEDDILKTQDNHLSLPNVETIGTKEEELE